MGFSGAARTSSPTSQRRKKSESDPSASSEDTISSSVSDPTKRAPAVAAAVTPEVLSSKGPLLTELLQAAQSGPFKAGRVSLVAFRSWLAQFGKEPSLLENLEREGLVAVGEQDLRITGVDSLSLAESDAVMCMWQDACRLDDGAALEGVLRLLLLPSPSLTWRPCRAAARRVSQRPDGLCARSAVAAERGDPGAAGGAAGEAAAGRHGLSQRAVPHRRPRHWFALRVGQARLLRLRRLAAGPHGGARAADGSRFRGGSARDAVPADARGQPAASAPPLRGPLCLLCRHARRWRSNCSIQGAPGRAIGCVVVCLCSPSCHKTRCRRCFCILRGWCGTSRRPSLARQRARRRSWPLLCCGCSAPRSFFRKSLACAPSRPRAPSAARCCSWPSCCRAWPTAIVSASLSPNATTSSPRFTSRSR